MADVEIEGVKYSTIGSELTYMSPRKVGNEWCHELEVTGEHAEFYTFGPFPDLERAKEDQERKMRIISQADIAK